MGQGWDQGGGWDGHDGALHGILGSFTELRGVVLRQAVTLAPSTRHHSAVYLMASGRRAWYGCGMGKGLKTTEEDVAALTVRVPRELVIDIDRERNGRPVRVPRNTWILEAVVEKLDRERQSARNGTRREEDDGQK